MKVEKKENRNKYGLNKKTDEGWNIYHANDLKLDQGKDTDLCPFDCECCF